MRKLFFKLFGVDHYITSLQEANTALAYRNEGLAESLNQSMKTIEELLQNSRSLYECNNELTEANKSLTNCNIQLKADYNTMAERLTKIEEENEKLVTLRNAAIEEAKQLNAQCAKFFSQKQSLIAKYGALKKKLAKYEQA